jgi:cytosine/adenosine deaminase-related metal-dependent hydrolase
MIREESDHLEPAAQWILCMMTRCRPQVTGEFYVAGHVLSGGRFFDGHVLIDDGSVIAVGEGPSPVTPLANGIVLPGLINAHTHVGDAAVPPPPADLGPAEIFPPPDGYKHRMLAQLPATELEAGITQYLDTMRSKGTIEHTDFREGGLPGVDLIRSASGQADTPPRSRVFGRPAGMEFDSKELDQLLASVDGIGLSAAMDWPRQLTMDVVTAAHDMGKPVALHCSESEREELSWVLDLEPEFLVHMVFGTNQDFRDLAAADVPVAVCPRSTHKYTKAPPVVAMTRAGVELRVGSDNAMLQGPSVLDDLIFLWSQPGVRDHLDPMDMLAWVLSSAKSSNIQGGIGVSAGSRDLAVLTFEGSDPLAFIEGPQALSAELVMIGGRVWRR